MTICIAGPLDGVDSLNAPKGYQLIMMKDEEGEVEVFAHSLSFRPDSDHEKRTAIERVRTKERSRKERRKK